MTEVKKAPLPAQYKGHLCNVHFKTTLIQKSGFGRAHKIYNKISNEIKTTPFSMFKKTLFKMLINKNFYFLNDYLNNTIYIIVIDTYTM